MNLPVPRAAALLAACALLASALGCSGQPVVGGAADANAPTDSLDVPADDVDAGGCTSDEACRSTPATPACDRATGRCVACVPGGDTCQAGQYCDPASNSCVRGCASDDACRATAGDDAGVGDASVVTGGRCNPTTHTCVDCVTDEHCPAGQRCIGNTCAIGCVDSSRCPTGQTCCMGGCVDTQANAANCGACGTACTVANGEPRCDMGMCAVGTCTGAFRDCDTMAANGCEADTLTDLSNCGTCGRACPTPAHARATCGAGVCGFTCDEGFADCDMSPENGCEVDLRTSADHCGMCDVACSASHGTPSCVMGACAVAACESGFGDCDMMSGTGCETDVRTSTAHCGTCGTACPAPAHGTAACAMGTCGVGTCDEGFADCDRAAMNGCEVETRTDVMNCGTCGAACRVDHGTPDCAGGRCAVGRCDEGFADCDMNPENGCETDLRTSTGHCGRCGNACMVMGGTAACVMGACAVGACAAPLADCDMMAGNGCETDTGTSVTHCGACGTACRVEHGTPACTAGRCAVARCDENFGDCDGDPSNGCETDLRTATGHCGRCGNACSVSNGAPGCAAGACTVASCNAGFADCDMSPTNGCETVTTTDVSNCGRCGNACPTPPSGTAVCRAGACGIGVCASGTDDCDGDVSNGCETRTATDVMNCGACRRPCAALPHATVDCTGGVCGVGRCDTGFADCDGNPANGCEVDLRADTGNCGRCGNRCSVSNGTAACAASACAVGACNPGFADCDGMAGNGCEVDTRTTTAHCGRCGNTCAAPAGGSAACVASVCVQSCPAGQSNCGGVCRPTGATCTSPGSGGCQLPGTVVCSGTSTVCSATPRTTGACTSPTGGVCNASGDCACASGETNCGGTCRNLASDTSNCGACGRVCTAPTGGTVSCTSSTCVQSCPAGQSNCGGVCRPTGAACTSSGSGGCQSSGSIVCSGTSTVCSATPRTSGTCTSPAGGSCNGSGDCVCPAGQTSCSGTCRNLASDTANCGVCGRACGAGQACVSGVCVGEGSLRFTLTWSTNGDMDLHVLPPCGTEIYYGRTSGCGGTLDHDDTTTRGPENIFWSSSYTPGRYYVCPEAFTSAVAGTTWTLTVVRAGVTVATRTGVRGRTDSNTPCNASFSGVQIFDL